MRIRRSVHSIIFSLMIIATVAFSGKIGAAEPTSLRVAESPTSVTISRGVQPVLEYRAVSSPMKPYVRQLFTPNGVQILRDSPTDHKHHHGLMFAIGVDGVDFWGESADAGIEKPRDGCQVETSSTLGVSCVRLAQTIDWIDTAGKRLLVEQREMAIAAPEKPAPVTMVLWNVELSVAEGVDAVKCDGHHYYGLGMRFLESMDARGRFFNSSREPGDTVRGSECLVVAKWCAYNASADGKLVTVAIFDHPSNPRHPNKMFTMSSPFAYLSATLNLWKEPLVLKASEKLRLSYAVAVWDGEAVAEQIESLYEEWTNAK